MNGKYDDRLKDYVDVAARIAEFAAKHPAGSLRPVNPLEPVKIISIGDKHYLQYVAAAYRTPDDPMPGIGVAWEPWPGTTPYTRDSEAMNCETSAWGRAIVAVLAADTRRGGVASADEVRAAQARQQEAPAPTEKPAAPETADRSHPGIFAEAHEGSRVSLTGELWTRPEGDTVRKKGSPPDAEGYHVARFKFRAESGEVVFVTAWHAAAEAALELSEYDPVRVSGKWHFYDKTWQINADSVELVAHDEIPF